VSVLVRKGEHLRLETSDFFLASPGTWFMSGQTVNVDGEKHML
jgi:hypothetical protein